MKITFLGATRMVTGSCYLIETGGRKVLVDCGMFQGSKLVNAFNERDFVFNPGEIDAMVLTHAHIDHSGLIPKLVAHGYKGPVYCTKTTPVSNTNPRANGQKGNPEGRLRLEKKKNNTTKQHQAPYLP